MWLMRKQNFNQQSENVSYTHCVYVWEKILEQQKEKIIFSMISNFLLNFKMSACLKLFNITLFFYYGENTQ